MLIRSKFILNQQWVNVYNSITALKRVGPGSSSVIYGLYVVFGILSDFPSGFLKYVLIRVSRCIIGCWEAMENIIINLVCLIKSSEVNSWILDWKAEAKLAWKHNFSLYRFFLTIMSWKCIRVLNEPVCHLIGSKLTTIYFNSTQCVL